MRLRSKERTGTLGLSLQVMVHEDALALVVVCRSFLQKDTGWRTLCWAQLHLHWCTSLAQLWVCGWIDDLTKQTKACKSHISRHSLIELHTLLIHWLQEKPHTCTILVGVFCWWPSKTSIRSLQTLLRAAYLVNWNDDDVRRYSWDVLSTCDCT